MKRGKRSSKQAEIEYPLRIDAAERSWLFKKPFGKTPKESGKELLIFSYIIQILNLSPRAKVLDVGTGPGWTAIFLANMGYRVTGVDISPGMIEIARERAERESLDIEFCVRDMEGDLTDWSVGEFDGILIYACLHHCQEPNKVLRNCFSLLKAGGRLLLVETNWWHRFSREAREARKRWGVQERGFWPYRLKRELRSLGFREIRQFYNPGRRPYSNSLRDLPEMLLWPFLERFFLSRFRTLIWLLAQK